MLEQSRGEGNAMMTRSGRKGGGKPVRGGGEAIHSPGLVRGRGPGCGGRFSFVDRREGLALRTAGGLLEGEMGGRARELFFMIDEDDVGLIANERGNSEGWTGERGFQILCSWFNSIWKFISVLVRLSVAQCGCGRSGVESTGACQ
jgi:hypothetical protein